MSIGPPVPSHVLIPLRVPVPIAAVLAAATAASSAAPMNPSPVQDRPAPAAASESAAIARHRFSLCRTGDGEWALVILVEPRAGWHVYWENPGDSGDGPQVEVTLPAGWQAGPVVFPRPDVAMSNGEVFYGYGGPVEYVVPLRRVPGASPTPGAEAAAEPAPWSARCALMACKDMCVIERLSGAGKAGELDRSDLPARFAGGSVAGRSLPVAADVAGVTARLVPEGMVIEGPAQGRDRVSFIPALVPGMEVTLPKGRPEVAGTVSGGRFRIEVPMSARGADPSGAAAAGLVLLGNAPADPCVRLSLPHPAVAP